MGRENLSPRAALSVGAVTHVETLVIGYLVAELLRRFGTDARFRPGIGGLEALMIELRTGGIDLAIQYLRADGDDQPSVRKAADQQVIAESAFIKMLGILPIRREVAQRGPTKRDLTTFVHEITRDRGGQLATVLPDHEVLRLIDDIETATAERLSTSDFVRGGDLRYHDLLGRQGIAGMIVDTTDPVAPDDVLSQVLDIPSAARYRCALVARRSLKLSPESRRAMNQLFDSLSETRMRRLNADLASSATNHAVTFPPLIRDALDHLV